MELLISTGRLSYLDGARSRTILCGSAPVLLRRTMFTLSGKAQCRTRSLALRWCSTRGPPEHARGQCPLPKDYAFEGLKLCLVILVNDERSCQGLGHARVGRIEKFGTLTLLDRIENRGGRDPECPPRWGGLAARLLFDRVSITSEPRRAVSQHSCSLNSIGRTGQSSFNPKLEFAKLSIREWYYGEIPSGTTAPVKRRSTTGVPIAVAGRCGT